ncbi:hypothetical protein [Pseudoalteromonas sp. SA25]|uniref:hypothetical protein n=1 Tax=Pseudoalteromonas sp. SA25 TaxID=2686347 RepID=UPI0013FDDF90|nr:hypothetical protein [Pseudoalteromonas sp. SA25]
MKPTKQDDLELTTIQKWSSALLLFLIFIFICFVSVFGIGAPKNIQTWTNTSSVFYNLTSTCIAVISLILLLNIWKDNRKELKETREALQDQLNIQNFTVTKETVTSVIFQIKELNKRHIILIENNYNYVIKSVGERGDLDFTSLTINNNGNSDQFTHSNFFEEYFLSVGSKNISNDYSHPNNYKSLIFDKNFFIYKDKIIALGLLLNSVRFEEYKKILRVILYPELSIFTWLFMIEISSHIHLYEKENSHINMKAVFTEIANLVYLQIESKKLLDWLSEEAINNIEAENIACKEV